jgi:ferric-dicitrate binding protein FerR (iron transport regulator)
MTSTPSHTSDHDHLIDLACEYFDGTATPQDVAWLEAVLATDADARLAFVKCGYVHGRAPFALEALANRPAFATAFPEITLVNARTGPRWRRWWPAAAVLVAALLGAAGLAGKLADHGGQRGGVPAEPALATIQATRLLLLPEGVASLRVGQGLDAGRVVISSGVLEMMLRNGVRLVLQGPGEFDLVDEMHAFVHEGTAVVKVPKGMSGFRLDTSSTDVLDLGTEFAVRAGRNRITEVQVYEGAVIASGKDGAPGGRFPKRIEAGEAARFNQNAAGGCEAIPYSESRFVRHVPSEPGSEHPWVKGWPEPDRDRLYFGTPRHGSIVVARAIGDIAIDADLGEWSHVSGFSATLRDDPSAEERVEGRMMYDDTHLYVAAHVRDPFPMRNAIDPALDPSCAWQGGSVELRISTDRQMGWPADANGPAYYNARSMEPTAQARAQAANPRLSHLTLLYDAASRKPSLIVRHGMMFDRDVINPAGYRGAFARDADGHGYTLEYAIPWQLLNAADDPPRSGDALAAIWQVHWSDSSGLVWRDQVIEIRNPHEIRQIVPFERAATWGRAEFQ